MTGCENIMPACTTSKQYKTKIPNDHFEKANIFMGVECAFGNLKRKFRSEGGNIIITDGDEGEGGGRCGILPLLQST